MILQLLSKAGIPIVIGLASFTGGMITHARIQKPVEIPEYKCPPCNCPPAVSLQPFDVDKLKNQRGTFVYSPEIKGVTISGTDSAFFKAMIKEGVSEALNEMVKTKRVKVR